MCLENLCESNGLIFDLLDIKRAEHIEKDLQELNIIDLKIYASTNKYVEHIKMLDNNGLLAHLYVRHMGDMYGGQVIKTKIPGSGTMYNFTNRSELVKLLREKGQRQSRAKTLNDLLQSLLPISVNVKKEGTRNYSMFIANEKFWNLDNFKILEIFPLKKILDNKTLFKLINLEFLLRSSVLKEEEYLPELLSIEGLNQNIIQ